ncbi:S8 family serine peptidase [Neobacillus vireti]|uniref:S8 family peptidase n=1 Tax=Neobacillus vireti TaxID=220686 RepID=UPI0030006F48
MYRKNWARWPAAMLTFLLIFLSVSSTYASTEESHKKSTALIEKKQQQKHISGSSKNINEKYEPDELIIKYKTTASAASVKTKHALKTKRKLKSIGAEVVQLSEDSNMNNIIRTLKKDPSVAFVQPNYTYRADEVPNDPSFNKLWGLNNTGQPINGRAGVANIDINYPEALDEFNTGTTPQQVVVGVIDTGIDINHTDLKDNIWTNPGEIAGNGLDDDKNGFIDDVHGWDFNSGDNTVYDPRDGDEHGTHVAGTIAAKGNNGMGITGIAPNVKIMPLKFLGADGTGSTANAVLAIEYAQKMGVKIINTSWSGSEYDQALKDAIDHSSMLFIAAAGNDGIDVDNQPEYPASYDSENVISVAAIDNAGNLADFSNYGVNNVDIAAPGVNILSTVPRVAEEGTGAEINNISYHYKAIFNGFGFENFSNADRQAAFNKATSYLGVTAASKILLVQDDEADIGNENFLSTYKILLNNAGLPYTIETIPAKGTGPDLSTLNKYDTVIWFTGNATGQYNPNLTVTDLNTLEQFLKSGKRLILSGQDILYRNEESGFVKDILSLNIKAEGGTRAEVKGLTGTAYDGAVYQVEYAPYADYITSTNQATTKVNLIFPATTYTTAYAYYDGTSMAAPHVTGVAALLEGKYPEYGPGKIKSIILASGDQLVSLSSKVQTGKALNAEKALTYISKPTYSLIKVQLNGKDFTSGYFGGGTTFIHWKALNLFKIPYTYKGNGEFLIEGRKVLGRTINGGLYIRWSDLSPGKVTFKAITGGYNFIYAVPVKVQLNGVDFTQGYYRNGTTYIHWTALKNLKIPYTFKGGLLFDIGGRAVTGETINGAIYIRWDQLAPGKITFKSIPGGFNFIYAS